MYIVINYMEVYWYVSFVDGDVCSCWGSWV